MKKVKTNDGVKIYYKDWGTGRPIVFCHGWPLSSDAWDSQMLFFCEKGYRAIAHDRRGHGRSTQTWKNNTMDQFADDLNELITELDLENAILVGHSMGGGEVVRYLGRYGSHRISKVVLVGAVPPLLLRTEKNSIGIPLEVFDGLRDGVMENRSQFFKDFTLQFYGYNRFGSEASEGIQNAFWLQAMAGGIKSQYDCIRQFSETDFSDDLKRINVPVLWIHGDDDQIVPIDTTALAAAKLIQDVELKIYPHGSHGLPQIQVEKFNNDLLEFIESEQTYEKRSPKRPAERESRPSSH